MSKTLKGVEVFAVGKWNGMLFQAHDLAAMVQAFEDLKDVHKVPLKMGHNNEQPMTDGKPALGWVTGLTVKGDKLCADFGDVPPVVAKAIENKLYRRVSIELSIDVKYKGRFLPFVVDAVALLGADLPAVNTLADLNAFMSRDAAQFSVERREKFSAVAGSLKETQMERKDVQEIVETALATALKPFNEKFTSQETAMAKLVESNTALTKQVETFTANKAAEAIKTKRTRAKAVLEALVGASVITPAQREGFTKAFGIDDDKRLESLDIEAFVAGLGVKETTGADGKVAFSKAGAGDVEKPEGEKKYASYEEACEALDKRANQIVTEKKVTYSAAKEMALSEDEELALVYTAGPKAAE